MNIDAQWIPIADELPQHGTHCIVGNRDECHPDNPLLGAQWKPAVFVDRQKRMDETLASAEAAGHKLVMVAPVVGPHLMFEMFTTGELKEPSEFTHWWPIPKPFGRDV